MPSSQKTTTKNEKLSVEDVVKTLAQVLAKAKRFAGPALLMVEFPTDYTRRETAEKLVKKLKEANDELIDIDLRKPINLLEVIEALEPNQVGSVHGLHAQPEVVRRLNWGRERLTDNNKRIVFWLNFEELKDLAERAPDFWAFRNRHLRLEAVAKKDETYFEPSFYQSKNLELSNLSLERKQERIAALEELLANIKDKKSFRAMNMQIELGLLYSHIGEDEKSVLTYKQALEGLGGTNNISSRISVLNNVANIYAKKGQHKAALDFYEFALKLSKDISDLENEGKILGNIGNLHGSRNDLVRSVEFGKQALEIFIKIGDREAEGSILGNLGISYRKMGNLTEALNYYYKALDISQDIDDKQSVGILLMNIGIVYEMLGRYTEASKLYEDSLFVARGVGDRWSEVSILISIGNLYKTLGSFHKAIEFYKQSIGVARTVDHWLGEAEALSNLGSAFLDSNNHLQAIACYIIALDWFGKTASPNTRIVLQNLINVRKNESNFDSFLYSLFPNGDKILQNTTGQSYSFFRKSPPDAPDKILPLLNHFEKQQKELVSQ